MGPSRKLTAGPLWTSEQQYRWEVGQLPRLTREQEQGSVAQARTGDREAREQLISACLPYLLPLASHFVRRVDRADFLDVCQMSSLAIVENLDRALAADNPIAYLLTVARLAIVRYMGMDDHLIVKRCKSDYHAPHYDVLSLDLPPPHVGEHTWDDLLEAPSSPEVPESHNRRLTEALATLTAYQREVIERFYGLNGRPRELLAEIDQDVTGRHDPNGRVASLRKHKGIRALRRYFGEVA